MHAFYIKESRQRSEQQLQRNKLIEEMGTKKLVAAAVATVLQSAINACAICHIPEDDIH